MNLPVEVVDAVKGRRCMIFLGSRATLEVAEAAGRDFPANNDLAKELGWKKAKSPLGVKQKGVIPSVEEGCAVYEAAHGRAGLVEFLHGRVGGDGLEPGAAHAALVRRFGTVFTTCQDDLVERAGRGAGLAVDVIDRGGKVPDPEAGRLSVVKLRGSFDRPDSLVLTRGDFQARALSPDARKQLRTLIRANVVLFVGYRPDEEEFERLFADLSDAYGGELPRCHLSVAQGPIDDYMWQKWVWRGLLMFTADPSECMAEMEARTA